jgi:hypothetical protein
MFEGDYILQMISNSILFEGFGFFAVMHSHSWLSAVRLRSD